MRNALILTGVWLGILVTAYAIVFWDQGIDRPLPISILEQQTEAVGETYIHPDGLFSLAIPTGWQAQDAVEYVQLTDSDASVTVWAMALETGDMDAAVGEAFELAGVGSDFEMTAVAEVSGTWDPEEMYSMYRNEDDAEAVGVYARRTEFLTVVLLARGAVQAVEALAGDIEWMWAELAIPADDLFVL